MLKLAFFGSAVCLVFFLSPLFKPGLIAGHDTGARIIHTQLMTQALKDGEFPVRWVEGPKPGLSHPLFNYYPPMFYYLTSVFALLGLSPVTSNYLVIGLFAIISWVSMYFFAKSFTKPIGATLAANLFLLTPYRISQIYVRAAYLEFAATSIIPIAFWGITLIFNHKRLTGATITALSLASIIMLHQPTFIIIAPALLVWIFTLWLRGENQPSYLFICLGTFLLGLLLAGTFILPLVAESSLIRTGGLSTNYFDFRQHFASFAALIYSTWGYGISQIGNGDGMSFQVGVINWAVILSAFGLFIYSHIAKHNQPSKHLSIFILIAIFAMFMATSASEPIWERFSTLGYLQYPWRYLVLTTFASSILVASLTSLLPSKYLLVYFGIIILFNYKYLAPSTYLSRDYFSFDSPNFPTSDPLYGLEPSYFPLAVTQTNSDIQIPRFSLLHGHAEIQPLQDTTTLQSFRAQVSDLSTITVNTHYFPGWSATIDNGQFTTTIVPGTNSVTGNMEITLLPGNYHVTLKLHNTPVRKLGNYLTLLTISGLIIIHITNHYRRISL